MNASSEELNGEYGSESDSEPSSPPAARDPLLPEACEFEEYIPRTRTNTNTVELWKIFRREKKGRYAQCKICDLVIKTDKGRTSDLRRHQRKHLKADPSLRLLYDLKISEPTGQPEEQETFPIY